MADEPESTRPQSGAVPNPLQLGRRVGATVRNLTEVVRYGGLETDEQSSPFTVEDAQDTYKLRHYYPDAVPDGAPAILLVPPLMITTEIWDVSPRTSAVTSLHGSGLDVWVVDFGHPDREPGGMSRTLADHVQAVSSAIDHLNRRLGADVILAGYSQGGMFAYQAAALRRSAGIDSLVTFGSPVDSSAPLPVPLSPQAAAKLAGTLADSGVFNRVNIPGWFSRLVFQALTPVKSVQDRVKFFTTLHDRDALLPREGQRRFLEQDGWTMWSGPAVAEFLVQFFEHNRMLEGGFLVGDRLVTLADITVPVLTVVGATDTLGHPDAVRAVRLAAPQADIYELTLRAGHFGLVVGSTANTHTWPAVANWARWRGGRGELPPDIRPAEEVEKQGPGGGMLATLTQLSEVGLGATQIAVKATRRAGSVVRGLASDAPTQLGRLSRLEHLTATTRISLGLLLDEQAEADPDEVLYLYGDRAHRRGQVKQRIDNVVRGLAAIGVRQGERVGVLMGTRPSAFVLIAALNRLGATAVVLRPDGELAREMRLGQVTRVISDPEHIDARKDVEQASWFLLGGGGELRDLPDDVVDMEQIDPDAVVLPSWYRPNPQRAADVAMVLFAGDGEATRAMTITNRRWAMSALGTASAANLRAGDTVYSVTPIHHSSALLMGVAGAVAGGSRLAMAGGTDPDTFWDEVRRYGVTHVTYTWTSLLGVVDAPPNPNEPHNPIKMFMGSGLPRSLWRRVNERFPDARVLEFYASTEGSVILANLTGSKPGSLGKPLPGTPEVRVVAYDMERQEMILGSDGFARECLADELGLLLARVDEDDAGAGSAMRSVFRPDDAWRSTGDLFLRDQQGDLWCAGPTREVIQTADGPVVPSMVRFGLGQLSGVEVTVAYGVPEGGHDVVVGACTVREGRTIELDEVNRVFARVPERLRPHYIQVVDEIPITTWGRPLWRPLQEQGVPKRRPGVTVWILGDDGHYA